MVDAESGEGPAREVLPDEGKIRLGAFGVAVVRW
jgi:hypothetical protein